MDNKGIKVLVVDDEADFRQLMAFWLESKGYSVITVSDGPAAVKTVQEKGADIVFLDLNMPVMDGMEVLKRIRKLDKEIPVVIISAYPEMLNKANFAPYKVSGIFYKGKDKDKEMGRALDLLETALRRHKGLKR